MENANETTRALFMQVSVFVYVRFCFVFFKGRLNCFGKQVAARAESRTVRHCEGDVSPPGQRRKKK